MKREEVIAAIRMLLAAEGVDLGEKKMMGSLIFMVNDHMCCGVGEGRILLRLGEAGAASACAKPHVSLMQIGEKTARGYVHVEAAGYAIPGALEAWVRQALAFVRTLPKKKARR